MWQVINGQRTTQTILVETVEQAATEGHPSLFHITTLAHRCYQLAVTARAYTGAMSANDIEAEHQSAAQTASEPRIDLPNIPLLEESIEYDAIEAKPTWRGWIHAATFPLAIVLGVILIVLAVGVPAKVSSAIFVASSLLLFGISALYHRFTWSERARVLLKRFDHSNIFLLIAGSYTPITVLSLPTDRAILLLSLVWGGALVGIGFRIFWIGAPRWLYVPIYVLLGWAAMMFIVDFFQANWIMMTLIIAGGLCYTAGAVIYGLKRPNPFPGRFGFHEIFHTLTLLAFLCHWTGIFIVAVNPPVLG